MSRIELPHVVRLGHPGDGAGRPCANLATRLWKTHVCKEEHENADGSRNVEGYRLGLKGLMAQELLQQQQGSGEQGGLLQAEGEPTVAVAVPDPIFVRAAVYDAATGARVNRAGRFVNVGVVVCTDTKGKDYCQVTEAEVLQDITTSRESGQKRKKKREAEQAEARSEAQADAEVTAMSMLSGGSAVASATMEDNVPIVSPVQPGKAIVSQPFNAKAAWEAGFAPILTGFLAHRSPEVLALHKKLRGEIKEVETADGCVLIYDDPVYQECIELLRRSQEQYLDNCPQDSQDPEDPIDSWARHWAQSVTAGKEWARILEDCRKTAFGLLKQVCDLWNPLGVSSRLEDKTVLDIFHKRRIAQIMPYTLVMDRANSFYHMMPDPTARVKVRGLYWYSDYDNEVARDLVGMAANPSCPSLNRRFLWLYYEFFTPEELPALARWLRIAFPPRLVESEEPAHMHTPETQQQLEEARLAAIQVQKEQFAFERAEALEFLDTAEIDSLLQGKGIDGLDLDGGNIGG